MIKIGFIDYFLSEWHANNYPALIRENKRAKLAGMDVCYAYAQLEVSPYDNVTTDEWCNKYGVQRVDSIQKLVDMSDCIVVLSPDNPEYHEALCDCALRSGKPVYVDKTFAVSKESAIKLTELAKRHNTPMYSSSSLRFSDELKACRLSDAGAVNCVMTGPYLFDIYAIHIFEMISTVMKTGAVRLMAVQNGKNRNIVVDYGGGRTAMFNQNETGDAPFTASVEGGGGQNFYSAISPSYSTNFIEALVDFFITGRPQADPDETVEIMAMLQCAKKALNEPFVWHCI